MNATRDLRARAMRADELQRVRSACTAALEENRGAIIFVAGEPGSGRTVLLRDLEDSFQRDRRRPTVLAGGMVSGQYVPSARAGQTRTKAVLDAGEAALGLAGQGLPILGLIRQVIGASRAARRLITSAEAAPPASPSVALPSLLRAAAQEDPLVCLVDDCDDASGLWWSQLLLGFADELNAQLPLILVLTVEGSEEPGPHSDAEADALFAARELVERCRALWVPLRRIGREQLPPLIGHAEPVVLERLAALCEGSLGLAADLWEQWRGGRIVERDTDLAPWRFAPGQPDASASVLQLVARRIRGALGDDLARGRDALQVLTCAALEGRHFTAEVVALALDRDAEEVVSLLDGVLTATEPLPWGLVQFLGQVDLGAGANAGSLRRYRFISPMLRVALARHCLTPDERAEMSAAVARGLESAFGSRSILVAPRLSVLHAAAADDAEAASCRRLADSNMPRSAILERARPLIEMDARCVPHAERPRAVGILLEAARICRRLGPLDEAVAAAKSAVALARSANALRSEATALRLQGLAEGLSGDGDAARATLDAAAAIHRAIGDSDGELEVFKVLAALLVRHEPEVVFDELAVAVARRRKVGDLAGERDLHALVAHLAVQIKDYVLAAAAVRDAQALDAVGDATVVAEIEAAAGHIARHQQRFRDALQHFECAHALYEGASDEVQACGAALSIGRTLIALDEDERARAVLRDVVLRAQSQSSIVEVAARHSLALLEDRAGHRDVARSELRACVDIYREIGHPAIADSAMEDLLALEDGHASDWRRRP